MTTGRHADTALWYQRLAAASAHTEHSADSRSGSGGGTGSSSSASGSTSSGGNASGEASAQGARAPAPAPPSPTPAFGLSSSGRGGDAAAGFLAAVLEGSSNSSRLDAKLAVSHSCLHCMVAALLGAHLCKMPLQAGSRR